MRRFYSPFPETNYGDENHRLDDSVTMKAVLIHVHNH